MTITEQIAEIKRKYPEAWEYIKEMMEYKKAEGMEEMVHPSLPVFDDNDEMISAERED